MSSARRLRPRSFTELEQPKVWMLTTLNFDQGAERIKDDRGGHDECFMISLCEPDWHECLGMSLAPKGQGLGSS